jgi:hypothetical protein
VISRGKRFIRCIDRKFKIDGHHGVGSAPGAGRSRTKRRSQPEVLEQAINLALQRTEQVQLRPHQRTLAAEWNE